MAGTWSADVSKRDVSLALCQDKLNNQDDKAARGKEGTVRIRSILKAHMWQVIFPPPPSHLNTCHAIRRCLAMTVKFSFSLLAPQKGHVHAVLC